MVQSVPMSSALPTTSDTAVELGFHLPDPHDEQVSDSEFEHTVSQAWQICDRFDLQTDIWRGRILRTVRDREKRSGDGRGTGFLNWLKERDISKSQAYSWIEVADSADTLIDGGFLEAEHVNQFSKRAFVETAQSAPEVQQMVGEAARRGDHITRREVRHLSDDWTAMSSELLPAEIRQKAADNSLPTRYVAPLVRELEKLSAPHQAPLQEEVAASPDLDTVKQVTAEARYLAKYLQSATEVQALTTTPLDLESALEEALRVGCLSSTADMVNQAAQLEQTIAKLYTTWKRLNNLAERVYVDSGASTPHLRSLLTALAPLISNTPEVRLGDVESALSQVIRVAVSSDLTS
ncbi:MAG: hypothetical protein IGR80_14975 [Synechococcales cyanobacterium K44_A2020_017]|nr:hypothetical protein [Synechococcales cyanobacterium K32_A2020_035]MBF2096047.1 hypothetical protein [Synechococcales cyanobacterium K44_A2020_017]